MDKKTRDDILIKNRISNPKDEGMKLIQRKANVAGFIGFLIIWVVVFSILYFQGVRVRGAGLTLLYGTIGSQYISMYLQVRKNEAAKKQKTVYLITSILFILACVYSLLTLLNIL